MGSQAHAERGGQAGPAGCYSPTADDLRRELACLMDLGALTTEEAEAFSMALEDLYLQAAHAGNRDEYSRMTRLLAADLDLAYQRLGYSVSNTP